MENPGEYLRSVVRVFSDYADTVLWFAPGPVDYADAHISDELRDAMVAWESRWYSGLTNDFEWISPEIEHELALEGERLALALSEELGDSFDVEYDSADASGEKKRVRGTRDGSNAAAVAAFRRMAQDDLDEHTRIQEFIAEGGHVWIAGSRATGAIYRPGGRTSRSLLVLGEIVRRVLPAEMVLLVISAMVWGIEWLVDGHRFTSIGTGIGVFIGGNLVGAWNLWRERRKYVRPVRRDRAQ